MKGMSAELAHIKQAANMQVRCAGLSGAGRGLSGAGRVPSLLTVQRLFPN